MVMLKLTALMLSAVIAPYSFQTNTSASWRVESLSSGPSPNTLSRWLCCSNTSHNEFFVCPAMCDVVIPSQNMDTWKQLEDLFIHLQLFHYGINRDLPYFLCCPCFHSDLSAWHPMKVVNQQYQDIGVSCRDNNGCLVTYLLMPTAHPWA